MKAIVLAVAACGALPTALSAQRYDYHLLLDSSVTAAMAALERSGHRPERAVVRPDGVTEARFSTQLPDSSGTPARGELRVVVLSRADSIIRIFAQASAERGDTAAVREAGLYFIRHLTRVFGRPAHVEQDYDWCWTPRRRFVSVSMERAGAALTLNVAYDWPLR
ncbi:MAG TPA: hypothetical protein VNL98_03750 [Gemmatimonadales bacterium]|nr:hypothetical protein [Gemmatimonadales bacterium]